MSISNTARMACGQSELTTQKLSWGLFVAGGFTFLASVAHSLQAHSTWSSLATPQSVGEMLGQVAAAGIGMLGALGIVLKSGGN
jgi:hypothetical protein